eukprot:2850185-Pyramimonas_sp.AAC.1
MPPRASQSERPREVERYMRGQEEARLKATTAGMLRTRDCSGMGWWGCAKREESPLMVGSRPSSCGGSISEPPWRRCFVLACRPSASSSNFVKS